MPVAKSIPASPAHTFLIGLQYYITARGAWLRGFYSIAGNLFHHGFEMMLKGVLLHRSIHPPATVKKQKHDLPWFWVEVSKNVPWDWSRFDIFIDDLHRWELVRFGDYPLGMSYNLRIDALRAIRQAPGKPGHDEYKLCIEDADELFVLLCREMGWPDHIIRARIALGLADYEQENLHPILKQEGGT